MIKFENTQVTGFEPAIRGMRNPKNSWDRSDSGYCETHGPEHCASCPHSNNCNCDERDILTKYIIGPNDMKLMKGLRNAGSDHRKCLRYIDVYVDITAPLYWWKEFKTYRKDRTFVDDEDFYDYDDYDNEMFIEMNSCSTMHKIHSKEFTLDDFSHEHLGVFGNEKLLQHIIGQLNIYRKCFVEFDDLKSQGFFEDHITKKDCWWQMIQLLPSSYNQKRTVKLTYEVLNRMYKSRKNHKLDEWKEHDDETYYGFCDWIKSLPYSELITGDFKD